MRSEQALGGGEGRNESSPSSHLGTLRTTTGRQGERQTSNRFNKQNNNSTRASRFFVHFFAVLAQLRREMTKFFTSLLENGNGGGRKGLR